MSYNRVRPTAEIIIEALEEFEAPTSLSKLNKGLEHFYNGRFVDASVTKQRLFELVQKGKVEVKRMPKWGAMGSGFYQAYLLVKN